MKSIIERLSDKDSWNDFLRYKQEAGHLSGQDEEDLVRFVREEAYIPVVRRILSSGFSVPRKRLISKLNNGKKRTVYIFPPEENYILKLMTFLLIRRYDSVFADNLYSFRARQGVRRAVTFLKGTRGLASKYVYKTDISDYFNSVDIGRLLPLLREVLADDDRTCSLIADLLLDTRVLLPDGSETHEQKGIMAGVPLSSFLANVYLSGMDWHFQRSPVLYARYSDDIILFAPSAEARSEAVDYIRAYLREAQLKINGEKEVRTEPGGRWTFLGISYENGVFDVSEVSVKKLKMKMRRKSRALLRWKARKNIDNLKAAKAFVKFFNRKLYDNENHSELTWTRWFFPLINTAESLRQIDRYMQECLRHIATGKHNRSRYRFTYDEMKRLGYRSLVHEYYAIIKDKTSEAVGSPTTAII